MIGQGTQQTSSCRRTFLRTALCVLAQGYFLHQGVVDYAGGISTPLAAVWHCQPRCWQDDKAPMRACAGGCWLPRWKRQPLCPSRTYAANLTALIRCSMTAGWQESSSTDTK